MISWKSKNNYSKCSVEVFKAKLKLTNLEKYKFFYTFAGDKTIEEKWRGSCKGKKMRGDTLTWGDAETIRRAYNCLNHVSNAKLGIL